MDPRKNIKDASSYVFWTLLLQSVSWVLMGILVILYPVTLFILVAATFIWIGLTTFLIAWRIRRHAQEMFESERAAPAAA